MEEVKTDPTMRDLFEMFEGSMMRGVANMDAQELAAWQTARRAFADIIDRLQKDHDDWKGSCMRAREEYFALYAAWGELSLACKAANERAEKFTKQLEATKGLLWMAKEYAEAGGDLGPEMRKLREACAVLEIDPESIR
jgi:hypothetical protein